MTMIYILQFCYLKTNKYIYINKYILKPDICLIRRYNRCFLSLDFYAYISLLRNKRNYKITEVDEMPFIERFLQ